MIINANERNYLLDSMMSLLDGYDYNYNESSLNRILDTWESEKEVLIQAFKTHPNYVEGQFMIAFDADYERTVDRRASDTFGYWIRNVAIPAARENFPESIKGRTRPFQVMPENLYDFFYFLRDYAERTVSEHTARVLSSAIPEVSVHVGQKTSRVVNKICVYLGLDKVDGYNREFAKYADSLSPLVIKRHTVLSINPLDYLTMSFGNSWASCHTIDKNNKRGMPNNYSGCYSSGTVSYMLDPSSMVLYTVDKSYEGNEYWNVPKINRQMFHWGEEKLVQGRLYPQDCDGDDEAYFPYRNIVQQIISTIFNFPNLWTLKKGTTEASRYIISSGTNYPDYYHYKNCSISYIKGSENTCSFVVGEPPICIDCGERHHYKENINCCQGMEVCADCGETLYDEEDVYYVDGVPYCRDCVSYCDRCGEYHRGESTWIESEGRYVCEDCLDNDYTYCERCGEYERDYNATWIESERIHVCRNCLDDDYTQCDDCGCYVRDSLITYHNGDALCPACYNRQVNDNNENY